MTASTVDYALMAGAAYFSTRDVINRLPFPEGSGWSRLAGGFDHRQDDSSGFEAAAFVKGGEIVISFAGTYPDDISGDWLQANAPLVFGGMSPQLFDAVAMGTGADCLESA